jgi:signal transduction histidine kinase
VSTSLRRRLTLLLVTAGGALVVIAVLGVMSIGNLTRAQGKLVDRVQVARIASLDLQVALFEQQASVRGYVLSGAAAFLDDLETAREVELAAAAELSASMSDAGPVLARLDALEARSDSWRATLATPAIDARTAGREEEAVARLTDPDATSFDEVSAAGVELGDALRELREQAVADTDRAIAQLVVTAGLAMTLIVVVGAIIAIALRRDVLRPLDRLASDARTVASGGFDQQVAEHGPAEIRHLARDVEAMRWQILLELQQAERSRIEFEQQAVDLQRSNRDLEQFAYVASHDLQEPLRKVAGFCQLLERRYGDQLDDRAREYIHYAVDGAERMQTLINDLLMFSRVGRTTERFERVDLGPTLEEAWRDVEGADTARLEASELPTVAGDPALLRTLFVNLLSNAVKFRSEVPPIAQVSAEEVDGAWDISVQDNGIGLDPQFADRIFDIFQRLHTRDVYDGTGIGLAICKRIVEFHGGSIRLSPSNEGACFVIRLPALDDEAAIEAPPSPPIPHRPEGSTW